MRHARRRVTRTAHKVRQGAQDVAEQSTHPRQLCNAPSPTVWSMACIRHLRADIGGFGRHGDDALATGAIASSRAAAEQPARLGVCLGACLGEGDALVVVVAKVPHRVLGAVGERVVEVDLLELCLVDIVRPVHPRAERVVQWELLTPAGGAALTPAGGAALTPAGGAAAMAAVRSGCCEVGGRDAQPSARVWARALRRTPRQAGAGRCIACSGSTDSQCRR